MSLYDVDRFETAVENYTRALSQCEESGVDVSDLRIRDRDVVHVYDIELATDLLYDRLEDL